MLEGVGNRFDKMRAEFRKVCGNSGLDPFAAQDLYKQALATEIRKVLRAEGVEIKSRPC